jgi:hypothetical protein
MKRNHFFKKAVVILFFYSTNLSAQTLEKWASAVNWDGVSPWHKYIIYSPLYMGPNAIPVPSMSNGVIDSINSFYAGAALHFSKGDFTQNLKFSANYCLVKDVIAFDLTWIPFEWYQMDDAVKHQRHVYYEFYNEKKAKGDIYLNTNLQILNRWKEQIRLALRMGYRFPTSSGVGSARYTDAPGYHFDLSAAKFLSKNKQWKLTTMCGFYVWQLNTYGQNDAFMFGAGVEYNSQKWRLKLNNSGFLGWKNNGDDPVVAGFGLERIYKQFVISLSAQHGLNDFSYSSVEFGARIRMH